MPNAVINPKKSNKQSGKHNIINTITTMNAKSPERIKHIIFTKSIKTPIVKNLLMIQKLHLDLFLYI